VFVSNSIAEASVPFYGLYSASKLGLLAVARSMQAELKLLSRRDGRNTMPGVSVSYIALGVRGVLDGLNAGVGLQYQNENGMQTAERKVSHHHRPEAKELLCAVTRRASEAFIPSHLNLFIGTGSIFPPEVYEKAFASSHIVNAQRLLSRLHIDNQLRLNSKQASDGLESPTVTREGNDL